MQKIQEAEELVSQLSDPSLTPSQRSTLYSESVNLFRGVCSDSKEKPEVRVEAFLSYMWCFPEEGLEEFRTLRDTLAYCAIQTTKLKIMDMIKNIVLGMSFEEIPPIPASGDTPEEDARRKYIAERNKIFSYEMLMTCVHLYNSGDIGIYRVFKKILDIPATPTFHKTETCKYLFASLNTELKEMALNHLLEYVSSKTGYYTTSKERYNLIVPYLSRSGLSTVMTKRKIFVNFDEEFVYQLLYSTTLSFYFYIYIVIKKNKNTI
jgi:hypothetical protein